ncbi:hypothetical protein [uncultured Shewanella sp.]|uniref:hypothetical protein n=1 Tax=uncultured Shewanella sp. TaxID=173975 RepID=UPI0026253B2F|nr:hypothetical protein [uncultured Shewanella sp.]
MNDIQVLAPMNRGGLGARSLNIALQAALNPNAHPKVTRFGWTYAPAIKSFKPSITMTKKSLMGILVVSSA